MARELARTIPSIELRDRDGRVRWWSTPQSRAADARARGETFDNPALRVASPPEFQVETPIHDDAGRAIGRAVAAVGMSALIPPDSARPLVPGARLGVRIRGGAVAIPLRNADFPRRTASRYSVRRGWQRTGR